MEEQRFDDLTRLVASKTSRRQVLKVLVGAAVGGLFLRTDPIAALAGTCNPKNACFTYCNTTFGGANTPAAKQCIQDANKCQGACYTCGPMSAGGTQPACCSPSSKGACASYSTMPCCASGHTCDPSTHTCSSCPSGQMPCKYAPCSSGGVNFAGGTLCCGTGETCVANTDNPGYGLCTTTNGSDCPSGTVAYKSLCYFNGCGN